MATFPGSKIQTFFGLKITRVLAGAFPISTALKISLPDNTNTNLKVGDLFRHFGCFLSFTSVMIQFIRFLDSAFSLHKLLTTGFIFPCGSKRDERYDSTGLLTDK